MPDGFLFEERGRGGPAPTSIDAAIEAESRMPENRDRVLASLVRRGHLGATREELALELGMLIQTVCPTATSLGESGQVRQLNETRLTTTGSDASVLVAVGFVDGRALSPWPPEKNDWKARALKAERDLDLARAALESQARDLDLALAAVESQAKELRQLRMQGAA